MGSCLVPFSIVPLSANSRSPSVMRRSEQRQTLPMDVSIYVPVSVVFPGVESTPADLASILRKLSRTDVLFWCARLNSVLTAQSDLSHEQKQAFGLRQFMSQEEIARCERQPKAT